MVDLVRPLSSTLPFILYKLDSHRVNIMGRPYDFLHQILRIDFRARASLASALHRESLGTLFAQHRQAAFCSTRCRCRDVDSGWDDAGAGGEHGLCECSGGCDDARFGVGGEDTTGGD